MAQLIATYRALRDLPGGEDTFFYVAEFGPVTADDICNLNDEQARRAGCEPTLDYRTVRAVLPYLERLEVARGALAWEPTGLGRALHRWLARS